MDLQNSQESAAEDARLLVLCTQRIHVFFQCLDERRYEELIGYFAQDGRWLRQGRWLHGRSLIRDALSERPASQATCHIMSNAHIREKTREAVTVEAYMTAYRHDHAAEGSVPMLSGPFRINQVTTVFDVQALGLFIVEQRMLPRFDFAAR